jgi:hypothetical protein
MPTEVGTQTSFNKTAEVVRSARTARENGLHVAVDPGLRRDDGGLEKSRLSG